jgi:protein SCO1/2
MKRSLYLIIFLSMAMMSSQGLAAEKNYQRTVAKYTVPDVTLVSQDGKKIPFKSYLETDKPVMVEFIYATCTTICPVLSAGFSNLQRKLGPNAAKIRLVSISIDPENDTPQVMKDYLKKYGAGPGWDFLSGSRTAIDAVMLAFDAYVSNKMYHLPLTLIRSPADGSWLRIKGLMGAADLQDELAQMSKK